MLDMLSCHKNNVPSRFSPQWLCGNSCTWEHDVWLYNMLHDAWYMYIYKLFFA